MTNFIYEIKDDEVAIKSPIDKGIDVTYKVVKSKADHVTPETTIDAFKKMWDTSEDALIGVDEVDVMNVLRGSSAGECFVIMNDTDELERAIAETKKNAGCILLLAEGDVLLTGISKLLDRVADMPGRDVAPLAQTLTNEKMGNNILYHLWIFK